MDENSVILLIPLAVIIGGIVVVAMGLAQRTKVLEMAHRERLAMIERGLTPPPAVLPEMRGAVDGGRGALPPRSRRSMTLGILMIGFGLGLGMLIGFTGDSPDAAIGVGGAVVVLGAALVVNALVLGRAGSAPPPPPAA